MRRGSGAIRMGIACALLFASLSLVVWRQSRALEEVRALDVSRSKRALLEAERTQLQREIQRLESRARVVAVAGSRLGLRVPSAQEIVILQEPAGPLADEGAGVQESRRGLLMTAERR
jgi:cell division protein FtsL